jgi:hypothetical protein
MAGLDELEEKTIGLSEEDLANANTALEEENAEESEDETEEPEYSEVEQEAMAQGWTRKEDFKGNPENWKPASQYVEWGEMRNNITNLTKQVKGMKKSWKVQVKYQPSKMH